VIDVVLLVQGCYYRGWKTLEATVGMEQIAGSFTVTASDRWQATALSWPIMPGSPCSLLLGPVPVIFGYVDEAVPEYNDRSHSQRISGRDSTGDLVDCAAIYKSGQWKKADLLKIANDLCSPFGIPVRADVSVGKPFDVFALQDGETVFEALDRAGRQRGVLFVSDANGGLIITRAGMSFIPTALVKGQNIERGSATYDYKDRFSKYIIKGQAPGSDEYSKPEDHMQLKSEAEDADVTRYRPTIIHAEQGDNSTYADRAKWECNVRAGRSVRLQYTVTGWEYLPGNLWQPNKMVMVMDDFLRIAKQMLICRCTYTLDDGGSRTTLELCPREAFEVGPAPKLENSAAKKEVM